MIQFFTEVRTPQHNIPSTTQGPSTGTNTNMHCEKSVFLYKTELTIQNAHSYITVYIYVDFITLIQTYTYSTYIHRVTHEFLQHNLRINTQCTCVQDCINIPNDTLYTHTHELPVYNTRDATCSAVASSQVKLTWFTLNSILIGRPSASWEGFSIIIATTGVTSLRRSSGFTLQWLHT